MREIRETISGSNTIIVSLSFRRVKGNYDIMLAIAGGDTPREVQRAFFNSADIAVVWKNFCTAAGDTVALAQDFLRQIK